MKEPDNRKARTLDYIVANLLDFFRDPKHERRYLEAAAITENLIRQMARSKDLSLEKRYLVFAHNLKNNLSPISIRNFAQNCLEYADRFGHFSGSSNNNVVPAARTLQKKAEKQLTASLAMGHSHACAVQRAANELLKSKKTIDSKKRLENLAKTHPLKEALEVLTVHGRPIAKEDIKSHLLRLKRRTINERHGEGVLIGLLEKVQSFSTSRLHNLLGDELFFLCRPLGYLDQSASVLIVEVPTSAHLHALSYRKLEILQSLRRDIAFSSTKAIKFKIKNSAF